MLPPNPTFNVKFPLLRLLQFLSDLKCTIHATFQAKCIDFVLQISRNIEILILSRQCISHFFDEI